MSAPTSFPPPTEPPLSADEAPTVASASSTAPRAQAGGYRWGLLALLGGAYVGALGGSIATRGIPLEREQVLAWMMGALVVVAVSSRGHRVGRVLTDWLPFLAVMVAYDYSRGWADGAGFPIHWTPQIRADELLFGGTLPTVWLQEHLLDPYRIHLWEVVPAITYVSHFIVPFVTAAYLWVRERDRYVRFARRFVTLSFMGVTTFVLYPAAPPWLASREGYIHHDVFKGVGRGWHRLNLAVADRVLDKGHASVNLTAAIPSLHAGYSALVVLFLWPNLGRVGRAVGLTYMALMGFTLVFAGEHYVVDVLIGWAYVGITLWLVGSVERWWPRGGRPAEPPLDDGPLAG
jgi:hypothetical protein